MSLLSRFQKVLGNAVDAAPKEKGGGPDIHHPEKKDSFMLQTSMVLPATNGKPNGTVPAPSLYTEANSQRARRVKAWFEDRLQRARQEGVFTEAADLDPCLAELLLPYNVNNRTLRPLSLMRMEQDMRDGRWDLNGESLKVSMEGLLNDGQHRCHAVINTGSTIKTLITFGVSRDSRLTVDQGATRMAGDYLSMAGIPNGNHAAAVAAMIWQLREFGTISNYGTMRPTKQQVQEVYYKHPKISDSIRAVPSKGSNLVGGISLLAFSHFMFNLKDREAATTFISKLVVGDELKKNDPIFVVRRRLMNTERLKPAEKLELIWHAWNAARAGRPLTISKINGKLPSIAR